MAICVGDLFSFTNTKSRRALASALVGVASDGVQEQLDAFVMERVEKLAAEMKEVAPRIIATIQGNHGYTFRDGEFFDQKLANLLGISYAPGVAMARF